MPVMRDTYTCKHKGVEITAAKDRNKTRFAPKKETIFWAVWAGNYFAGWILTDDYPEAYEVKAYAKRYISMLVN